MTREAPRRPVLHLKAAATSPGLVREPELAWKCRPCGALLEIRPDLADNDIVRCPACNARIGKAGDLRTDDLPAAKVRAGRLPSLGSPR